jgi:hypothetical protein
VIRREVSTQARHEKLKTKNQNKKPKQKRNPNKMKAITMRMQKFSRPGVILMATVVAIITSMVAANATQTITTPNAAFISYSLAPGANSAVITPATNRWVLVGGCCTTATLLDGVGQVSLLHIPSSPVLAGIIGWVGLEAYGPAAITQGRTSAAGTHIVWIDSNHLVDIRVASADTILVHNGAPSTMAGNVTLIW